MTPYARVARRRKPGVPPSDRYAQFEALPEYQNAHFTDGKVEGDGTDRPFWSGPTAPPVIGSRVKIPMNNLGAGKVVGYFVEHNWLGLLVELDEKTRPEWHRRQCGEHPGPSHIFGVEFTAEEMP